MREKRYMPKILIVNLALGLFLLSGVAFSAQAGDLPVAIQKTIEQEFPGAVIKEVRKEDWEGQSATEVELTARDGGDYEVIVSNTGKILSVEEEKGLPLIGGELALGLALLAERGIYKDVDAEFQPVPFFNYENGRFEIVTADSIDAAYKLYRTNMFSIAVKGSVSLENGYDPDDSDYLKGMDELDTLYGAGIELEGYYGGWEAELAVLHDVSGEHDGQEVELSLGYTWTAAGFEFCPKLNLTWLSEDTVDYFYGVSVREARAGRPAYSPGSSYEIGAELMIQRPIFGNFTAVGIAEISIFGDEIRDSPLVDEDYEIEGILGVMYRF